jgi:hypothetical protein
VGGRTAAASISWKGTPGEYMAENTDAREVREARSSKHRAKQPDFFCVFTSSKSGGKSGCARENPTPPAFKRRRSKPRSRAAEKTLAVCRV